MSSLPLTGLNWPFLLLSVVVLVGVVGNILVCLAICLERRLQNATNFFLLSLAVADLFVSILVMPMAILQGLYGKCFHIFMNILLSSLSVFHIAAKTVFVALN